MLKLSLVIADEDKAYIESIVRFLMDKHAHKFQVNSFTNWDHLLQFLSKNREKVDIILITPEFYEKSKFKSLEFDDLKFDPIESIGLKTDVSEHGKPILIFLSNTEVASVSRSRSVDIDVNNIYKYQHGDRLVSNIMHIYEKHHENIEFTLKKSNKTKLISVYSPMGGAGKTTIAVNACINCARDGMRVFYINLETISSTFCFFEPDYETKSCDNFSNIIFAIKERDKNLSAKIEGIKFTDTVYDIHYMPPPDSALEMEELLPEEIKCLLHHVRSTGYYDIVFVDLSSTLSLRNIAVMEESDEIILIYTPDYVSKFKVKSFYKEIELYQKRKGLNLLNKITFVVNKYDKNMLQEIENDIDEVCSITGISQYVKIPVNNQLTYNHGIFLRDKTVELSSFNKGLLKLTRKYISRGNGETFK